MVWWNSPAIGVLILVLVFLNPWAGLTSLLASAAATAVAMALKTPRDLLKSGLYGLNGLLLGMVATWHVPSHSFLLPAVVTAAALSAPLTSAWINKVAPKTHLPVLTLPFLLIAWFFFLALRPLEPTLSYSIYEQSSWTAWLENRSADALPSDVALFFRSQSWLFFQNAILLGAVAFVLLLWRSRVAALMAFFGFLVGLALAKTFGANIRTEVPAIEPVAAFNASFVAVCLAGVFLRLSWASVCYALLGAAVAALFALGVAPSLADAGLPVLNGPFLIVTMLFLAIVRFRASPLHKAGLQAVPLEQVAMPESRLNLPWSTLRSDPLRLTLPFYGVWYVAQGTHGLMTHWGHSSYAWDFIVVDTNGRSCHGLGHKVESYYAWGLPVIAPAPGTVVRVVDSVPDNIPPEVNKKENWGNHVIIDHGHGLYSELSHFRQYGIVVKEGDAVARGQLLGYLGNSGFSMEPHLHYQLQNGPRTGAKTLPAKFWGYHRHNGHGSEFIERGAPQQGDLIGGPRLELPHRNGRKGRNGHSEPLFTLR